MFKGMQGEKELSKFKKYIVLSETTESVVGVLNLHSELSSYAQQEEIVFTRAQKQIENLEKQLNILEEYTQDYEDSYGKKMPSPQSVASLGPHSYRMVQRFTNNLKKYKASKIWENDNQLFFKDISSTSHQWPNEGDLNNTMRAFIRLQELLEFELSTMPTLLSGDKEIIHLRASHLSQIGMYGLHKNHFSTAIDFLEFSKDLVVNQKDSSISLETIEDNLEQGISMHNEAYNHLPENALNVYDHELKISGQKPKISRRTDFKNFYKGSPDYFGITPNFMALCSGEILLTPKEQSELFCEYQSQDMKWPLSPLKVEHHSKEVYQIYEILTEKEIQDLNHSKRRSEESGTEQDFEKNWNYLEELEKDPPNLLRKLELFTNFKMHGDKAGDPFIMLEYVVGRRNDSQTLPHVDQPPNKENADREGGPQLVSIILYLTDVEKGGETAFSNMRTKGFPTKGSALIWFNNYKNGENKMDTFHGSCPVIYGNKKIATKWVRYDAQFQTCKCSLNPDE